MTNSRAKIQEPLHDIGDEDETSRMIAADKVQGTNVYNAAGEKLGTVERVMIDKQTGKVAYAVMSFGGFLGIGDQHHPLPWSALSYDTEHAGYRVNVDTERLKAAPTVAPDQRIDWDNETWGRNLHDYYGIRPYWV